MNSMQSATTLRREALKGLLWMDFRRHREGFLIGLPSIAIVAMLIGLMENAGGPMFFWMCSVMGAACGIGFGLGESGAGVEEYSLSLPPTRRDRYYVRFALGVSFLLAMQFFGLAAGPFGWVRAAWELLPFELPEYRPDAPLWSELDSAGFYVFSVGLCYALFAETYAVCMASERKCDLGWITRVVPFVIGGAAVFAADRYLFVGNVGYLSGTIALIYTPLRLDAGRKAFERKAANFGGESSASSSIGRPTKVIELILGLSVLLAMAAWVYFSRRQ